MKTTAHHFMEGSRAVVEFRSEPPGKPCTLDHGTLAQFEAALDAVPPDAACLLIRTGSPRYFVVGANVNVLQTLDGRSIVPWVEHGHRLFDRLERLPLPTIARIEGACFGGGLELALACDFIVASASATFGQTEARLGFVPGWGGSARLARRIGLPRAKHLLFTGRTVDAAHAAGIGLVDFTGESAQLDAWIEEFLSQSAQCSRPATALCKALLHDFAEGRGTVLDAERRASIQCLQNGDALERVGAFLEERRRKRTATP